MQVLTYLHRKFFKKLFAHRNKRVTSNFKTETFYLLSIFSIIIKHSTNLNQAAKVKDKAFYFDICENNLQCEFSCGVVLRLVMISVTEGKK